MKQTNESLKQRLRKVAALAERGVGGERDNAQRLLGSLLKKHGLTVDDIQDGAAASLHEFKYGSAEEQVILKQCVVKVLSDWDAKMYRYRDRYRRRRLFVECTAVDAIEIGHMFKHHRALWAKDKELALRGFIHRHKLYGPANGHPATEDSAKPLSQAESIAVVCFASGFRDANYTTSRRTLAKE